MLTSMSLIMAIPQLCKSFKITICVDNKTTDSEGPTYIVTCSSQIYVALSFMIPILFNAAGVGTRRSHTIVSEVCKKAYK